MTQTDWNLTTTRGFNVFSAKANEMIAAVRSSSSGPNFPRNPRAGDFYIDSDDGRFWVRNTSNRAWVPHGNINTAGEFGGGGGLDAVSSDVTLNGDGTPSRPLSVANPLNSVNFYNLLRPSIQTNSPLTVIPNNTTRHLTLGLDSDALQTVVIRSAAQDRNLQAADRGKFLAISDTDTSKLTLKTIDLDDISTGLPDNPTGEGNYELRINRDGSNAWVKTNLPNAPAAQGKYELNVASGGLITWEEAPEPFSTDIPDAPAAEGNYELKVASDKTVTWAEAESAVSPSEATTSGAIQVASSESKTYSVAAGTANLPQSTLFNITIEINTDSKSLIFRGSDLVGGQTTRIGNRTFQMDFTDGTGLRVRISAGNAVAYEWLFAYGGVSGGTEVKTNSTLTGNGSTATPLAVATPFTEAEKEKLANLSETVDVDLGPVESRLDHQEELTNDIGLLGVNMAYIDAPASETQFLTFEPNTAFGRKLAALARGGKASDDDIRFFGTASSSFVSTATVVRAIVVLRIKPELNVIMYGIRADDVEADVHDVHQYRQIGTDDQWAYYIIGPLSGKLTARKRVLKYTTDWHGQLGGPGRDRIDRNAEALLDMSVVSDSVTRKTAAAADGSWTGDFGDNSPFRVKTIKQLQAGLSQTEINALTANSVTWLQDEILQDVSAAIVRINHTRANPDNYLFWSRYTGLLRLDSTNQIYRNDTWVYFRPHINTTGQAQATKLEVQTEESHTIYDGVLGNRAIESIGATGGKPQGQLFYAFSSGATQPVTSFRNDYVDLILGSTASGSVIRHDLRFMLRGTANDLTSTAQLKQITVAGQRFRNTPFTLTQGEFLNGDTQVNSVDTKSGLFNLFIPMTNRQWELITNNDSSTLDIEITYVVDGTDKTWRLRVPRLNSTQRATMPLAPWIPAGAIIGGAGGGKKRTRLGIRAWNLDNSQNARYQDTGIILPTMEDDDLLRVAVAHPSFSTKQSASYMWEFIKDFPMTGTIGGTASFNNTFSLGDGVDSGTPSPKVIFTLTSGRKLLVAFFVSSGPVGGAVRVGAWKE